MAIQSNCASVGSSIANSIYDAMQNVSLDDIKDPATRRAIEHLMNVFSELARQFTRLNLRLLQTDGLLQNLLTAEPPMIGRCKGGLVEDGQCSFVWSGGTINNVGGALVSGDAPIPDNAIMGVQRFAPPYGYQGFVVKECVSS